MCGIAGIIDFKHQPNEKTLRKMLRSIQYRGPNSTGIFKSQTVTLGVNRLSVVDLKTGNQPLTNEDGTIIVVYNGEIYNFQELKTSLERKGHIFKSKTDTEVLVHLYEEEGLGFVKKLSGMFAFALWDKTKELLILGRDQVGIKPLYYYADKQKVVFSSELKSLLASGVVDKVINTVALEAYLALGYIPQNLSIIKNVNKLLPGNMLVIHKRKIKTITYWDPRSFASKVPNKTELSNLLENSIISQTMGDVPLGVFLSGGLDSSLLVHYLAKHQKKVHTFSIKFTDKNYDESLYAKLVAKKYKTVHQEILYGVRNLREEFPEIINRLDEPLADPSLFPTYHLSKRAAKKITVALTGDGGDELFGGYPTFQGEYYASFFEKLPSYLDPLLMKLAVNLPISFGSYSKYETFNIFFKHLRLPKVVRQLEWTSRIGNYEFLNKIVTHSWIKSLTNKLNKVQLVVVGKYQFLLLKTYLPDDLLVKTDRSSMLNSLEARVPFLDLGLINYAFSTGNHTSPTQIKKQLKNLAKDFLPKEIMDRKKKGFGIPIASWTKNELKMLVSKNLNSKYLHKFVDANSIEILWSNHLEGKQDNSRLIWSLVILSAWLKSLNNLSFGPKHRP